MAETPIASFRLDEVTKSRLAQLAKERESNMTQVLSSLIEDATEHMVVITSIDTVPERDCYVNLEGHSTFTVLHLDPQGRKAHVFQEQKTGSTLITVWHGKELQYRISGHPDEEELRNFLITGRGQRLLRTICNGHGIEWDGSNMIGRMTPEAIDAAEELQAALMEFESKYEFWNASDWLYPGAEQRVTARTTDEELAQIASEFEAIAEADNVVLDEGVLPWLTRYRNELQDEEEWA